MIVVFGCRRNSSRSCAHLVRLLARLRERHVDVVVHDHDEPDLAGEVEDPIERRVGEARGLAGDLRRDELLVDRELADAGEHAREGQQHAADVIGRVHVGGVEAGDHRVEARLLRRRQRAVGHRDERVGERVVVERRVGLQVVGRREVAGVAVRPRLLQRDAEQRDAPDLRPHDLQELVDVGAFLDVVRQVEVRVVDHVARAGGLPAPRGGPEPPGRARTEAGDAETDRARDVS